MKEQLSLSARPTTLDQLVGQGQMIEGIRGQIKQDRAIKSWLFVGGSGCGKTTTARILALSYQCQHQVKFGCPCKICRRNKSSFDIYEINASKVTGIRELEQELNGSELRPRMGPYRVYILDECFPRGTLVDTVGIGGSIHPKPIELISVGDRIWNASGKDLVSDVSRKRIESAVKISVAGRSVISSSEHPYFTLRGWVPAKELRSGDSCVSTIAAMRILSGDDTVADALPQGAFLQSLLRREVAATKESGAQEGIGQAVRLVWNASAHKQERDGTILQQRVLGKMDSERSSEFSGLARAYAQIQPSAYAARARADGNKKQQDTQEAQSRTDCSDACASVRLVRETIAGGECIDVFDETLLWSDLRARSSGGSGTQSGAPKTKFRENAPKQSRSYAGCDGEDSFKETWETVSRDSRWQRAFNKTSSDYAEGAGRALAFRVCNQLGESSTEWISNQLQSRSGVSSTEDSYRSGWETASVRQQQGNGFEEGQEASFVRVDSVEILERGHPELERYREADGFLYFYDIGAARHHSFSVNGMLVHNCHQISKQSQSLILKYLEDSPESTIYILCTTDPHMLSETIQSRCGAGTYRLRELSVDDTLVLVERLLKKVGSDLPADSLVDALQERQICYPRSIVQATEKYLAGLSPAEAVDVQGAIEIDTKALTRAVVKGDWMSVSQYLLDAQPSDARAIRLSCLAYLRKILLKSPEISDRTKAVADAVSILCALQNTEGAVMAAGIAAALYSVTARFSVYKH